MDFFHLFQEKKKLNKKMKKNQGHTCFACKKRENEKIENLQAWQH
jgi:PP-loop superfamily ATP-utilizing enzyme